MSTLEGIKRRSLFTEEEIRSTVCHALENGSAWKTKIALYGEGWEEASGMIVQTFPADKGTIKVLVITGRGRVYATRNPVEDVTALKSAIDTWPWSFLLEAKRGEGGWILRGEEDSI